MASVSQFNPYQCDQCGTANIVAAPVLYEQGTRTYSGTFHSGTSQSYSAQAVAPPHPRGYVRPFLALGIPIFFSCPLDGSSASGRFSNHPKSTVQRLELAVAVSCFSAWLLLLGWSSVFGRIARYNREVYPRLHWNWEHTYICRRCGKLRLIPS